MLVDKYYLTFNQPMRYRIMNLLNQTSLIILSTHIPLTRSGIECFCLVLFGFAIKHVTELNNPIHLVASYD